MTPHRAVLVIGLLTGVAFVFLTPPFQAPDEPDHLSRAYHISQGSLLAERRGEFAGGDLPASLPKLAAPFLQDLAFQRDKKVSRAMLREAFAIPLEPSDRMFVAFKGTALYTPIPYLPQAFAVRIGTLIDMPPLVLLYLARTFNLLTSAALLYYAVRIAPCFKWVLASLALTPMAIFLRASASADALTAGAAFLFISLVLSLAFGPVETTRRSALALFVAVSVVALSKPVYVPLALLVFLIPRTRLGSRGRGVMIKSVVVGLAIAAFALSSWISHSRYTPLHPTDPTHPREQVDHVLDRPAQFIAAVARTYVQEGRNLRTHFIGTFGWLDTPLDMRVVDAYCLMLLLLALVDGSRRVRISLVQRALIAAVCLAVVLAITLSQYLIWTPVGRATVEGLQGRYFMPIGPLPLLLLCNARFAAVLAIPTLGWLFLVAHSAASAVGLAGLPPSALASTSEVPLDSPACRDYRPTEHQLAVCL